MTWARESWEWVCPRVPGLFGPTMHHNLNCVLISHYPFFPSLPSSLPPSLPPLPPSLLPSLLPSLPSSLPPSLHSFTREQLALLEDRDQTISDLQFSLDERAAELEEVQCTFYGVHVTMYMCTCMCVCA